ncbi:F0F1 ATP synthase subunit epsilon [Nocardioides sp. zg-DK7169]|uniref:F0F1 ATP synthase subunit epsilon n=1 Tax=Nocardioides sp. zg-DK7169 TaxID=2736600 RepID=UPI001552530C|nr:F0F1 ATP synthase subunit epsilon [Nocardioides sp. zg-DK7169]NPC98441.1 F0F1 ATP synthase subunit epsilon [Nocardioides sp. zg-DK7169]
MAQDNGNALHVELVAADRVVWSGEANMVIARTTEGDVGVLPGHAPMLSLLVHAVVEIVTTGDEVVIAAADGGFLSVADNRVSVLSPHALLSNEIDVDAARADLEEAYAIVEPSEAEAHIRRAEARIRAVERAS